MKLIRFYGQFHPASIHLPVALLLVAALAELICWIRPRPVLHDIAAFNLFLGAVSAVVVATMGWAMAATMGIEPDLRSTLFWHRWLGTGTAVWAAATLLLWWRWYLLQSSPVRLKLYRTALFAGAALVSVTGHLGGLMVYGLDYFTWPFSK